MVELMVVVAILGITAAVAISGYRSNPTGGAARKVAAMLATAHRVAVQGGMMTTGTVACASQTLPRAYIEVATDSVTVWQYDDATAAWANVSGAGIPTDVLVYSVEDQANTLPGVTPTATSLATPLKKYYCPDGTSDGFTIYLRHKTDATATRYRIVSIPLSPSPQVFQDW
jgi:type II secretory pathway pseudopilin PulG